MDKRYRVVPPLEDIQPTDVFLDRIYTQIPTAKPDHPTRCEGEWVCDHAPCPVRMIQIRVRAMYHQHLPRLRCPLCLRTLVFRHWLSLVALQEVPTEPLADKVAPAPRRKRGRRAVS